MCTAGLEQELWCCLHVLGIDTLANVNDTRIVPMTGTLHQARTSQ